MSLSKSVATPTPRDPMVNPTKDEDLPKLVMPSALKSLKPAPLPIELSYIQDRPPRPDLEEPKKKDKDPLPDNSKTPTPPPTPATAPTPNPAYPVFRTPLDEVCEKYKDASKPIGEYREAIFALVAKRNLAVFRSVCDTRFTEKPGGTEALEAKYETNKQLFAKAVAEDKTGRIAEVNKQLKPYFQKLELSAMPITNPAEIKNLREVLCALDRQMEKVPFDKEKKGNTEVEIVTVERLTALRERLYVSPYLEQMKEKHFEASAVLGYLGKKGSPTLEMGSDVPPERKASIAALIAKHKSSPEAEAAAVKKRDDAMNRAFTIAGFEILPATIDAPEELKQARPLVNAYIAKTRSHMDLADLEIKFAEQQFMTVQHNGKQALAYWLWHRDEPGNRNYLPGVKDAYSAFQQSAQKEVDKLKAQLKAAKVPDAEMDNVLKLVFYSHSHSTGDLHYRFRFYELK